jgi:hypothetical protein
VYCCKYGFQSDTIVVSRWLYSADLIGWQCHVRQGHAQLFLCLVLHRERVKTFKRHFQKMEKSNLRSLWSNNYISMFTKISKNVFLPFWCECSLGGTLQSFEFLLLIGYSAWLQRSPIMCSDWLKFQKSFQKPLDRLEPNIAGMFLGWSSTKLLFFVPVGYSIWLPGPIICSDWLKFQRSS